MIAFSNVSHLMDGAGGPEDFAIPVGLFPIFGRS